MPPRPPSSHLENQTHGSQSPMATQGYPQQMMPPPMGSQMSYTGPGPTGGKMGSGPGMAGAPVPPHYPTYNSQYPQGGNYRGQGMMGPMAGGPPGSSGSAMPGNNSYPQSMYNGPSQMGPGGAPMYNNMMNRSMPPYNSSYGPGSNMPMNSHFGSFNSHMGPGQGPGPGPGPGSGPNPSPPTSGSVPGGPGPGGMMPGPMNAAGQSGMGMQHAASMMPGGKGAQAAAQAALIAAASSAGTRMPSRGLAGSPRMMGPQSGGVPSPSSMNAGNLGNPSLNSLSNQIQQITTNSVTASSKPSSPAPNSSAIPTSLADKTVSSSSAGQSEASHLMSPMSNSDTQESSSRPSSTATPGQTADGVNSTSDATGSDGLGSVPNSDSTSVDSGFHSTVDHSEKAPSESTPTHSSSPNSNPPPSMNGQNEEGASQDSESVKVGSSVASSTPTSIHTSTTTTTITSVGSSTMASSDMLSSGNQTTTSMPMMMSSNTNCNTTPSTPNGPHYPHPHNHPGMGYPMGPQGGMGNSHMMGGGPGMHPMGMQQQPPMGNMPPYNMPPTGNMHPGNMPPNSGMAGNMPPGMAGNMPPGNMPPGGPMPPGNAMHNSMPPNSGMPGNMPPGGAGNMPPGGMPGNMGPGGAMPGNMPPGSMPPQGGMLNSMPPGGMMNMMHGNMPNNIAPGGMPQGGMPGNMSRGNMPGHIPPGSMGPGNNLGTNGKNHSMGPMNMPSQNNATARSSDEPPEKKKKKASDMTKLYDLGGEMDRRPFLDKLLGFLEEKGTPITTMPNISKQPLDLYKLYHCVLEKGGFVEVNKNKRWKEICSVVNIGCSASAAFTLKKNYIRYLFAFECKFDLGGVDPAPILAELESQGESRKREKKRVPSPGSQSSQDAFQQAPAPNSQMMDGYHGSGGMHPPYMQGPDGQMMPGGMGGPGSGMMMQNNMMGHPNMMHHQGSGPGMMGHGPNSMMMGSGPNAGQNMMPQGGMMNSNSMMGPSGMMGPGMHMGSNSFGSGPSHGMMGPGPNSNSGMGPSPGPALGGSNSASSTPSPLPSNSTSSNGVTASTAATNSLPGSAPNSRPPTADSVSVQDPFSDEPGKASSPATFQQRPGGPLAPSPTPGGFPSPGPPTTSGSGFGSRPSNSSSSTVPFSSGDSTPIAFRRTTDPFQPNSGSSQFPGQQSFRPNGPGDSQYPNQPGFPSSQHPGARPALNRDGSFSAQGREGGQWSPMHGQRSFPPNAPGTPPMGPFGRPAMRGSPQPRDKVLVAKLQGDQGKNAMLPSASFTAKKEVSFPADSVEATQPTLTKRRRLTHKDICPVEAWRLMMALKSGLLAESTWAIDTLNILLFDDVTITYFNLQHMPGLLEVLTEHLRSSLIQIFHTLRKQELQSEADSGADTDDGELGVAELIGDQCDAQLDKAFYSADFTWVSRQGKTVVKDSDYTDSAVLDSKKWDKLGSFVSGRKHWLKGGGDITQHVVPCFESSRTHQFLTDMFYPKSMCRRGLKRKAAQGADGDGCGVGAKQQCCASDRVKCEEGVISHDASDQRDHSNVCSQEVTQSNSPLSQVVVKIEPGLHSHQSQESLPPSVLSDNTQSGQNPNEESVKGSDGCAKENSENCVANDLTCEDSKASETKASSPAEVKSVLKETLIKLEADAVAMNQEVKEEEDEMTAEIVAMMIKEQDGQLEEEAYRPDESPLSTVQADQEELGRRCVAISNIFRSLSCVPGNEALLAKHRGLMWLLGRLLLLQHNHPLRSKPKPASPLTQEDEVKLEEEKEKVDFAVTREEEVVEDRSTFPEWWWDTLESVRENSFVILANICSHMHMRDMASEVCLPLLDGLLHWMVCPSSAACDPLLSASSTSLLSPQRLVLEALCKLCIHDENVDLLLATPPFSRIMLLLERLMRLLADRTQPVPREFSIVLLSRLVQGDSVAARAIALQHPSIPLLIEFIECAEQSAIAAASQQGQAASAQSNPEVLGTSPDMLKRSASILLHMAQLPQNRKLFLHHQSRLLTLVMSQWLDSGVTQVISDVLFECSQTHPLPT